MKVYVLQHEHDLDEETTDVKMIGIYGSEGETRAAQERLSREPGFREHRDGFSIDAYDLNQDHWTKGFSTVRPDGDDALTGIEAA